MPLYKFNKFVPEEFVEHGVEALKLWQPEEIPLEFVVKVLPPVISVLTKINYFSPIVFGLFLHPLSS